MVKKSKKEQIQDISKIILVIYVFRYITNGLLDQILDIVCLLLILYLIIVERTKEDE